MCQSLVVQNAYGRFRSKVYRVTKKPYLAIILCAYVFIALLVSTYIASPSRYTSNMELVLPGTGNSSNVSLNDVGQVVSQTATPFGTRGFNPRVNYKVMLSSRRIIANAAAQLGLSIQQFGEPKVTLTEQTSILEVTISADTPEVASAKLEALYKALQDELNALRADEVAKRDESIESVLEDYRQKTNKSRANILDFQERSFLISPEQMTQLTLTLATVREKHIYVQSELQEMNDFIRQMGTDLGITSSMAARALTLQSDPEFLGFYEELRLSAAAFSDYSSKWGSQHPKVIAAQKRNVSAREKLYARGTELTGMQTVEQFMAINLENNPRRAQLFSDFVEAQAQREGLKAKSNELRLSIEEMEGRLKIYAREVAELSRLQREFDMADAVFTSAAARLEANKSDVFASYPVIQMLTQPDVPVDPSSPKALLAIVGGVMGAIFLTIGLVIVWKREALLSALLKRK
ncbi:GumC family protein [Alteromonas gracilis]|uniref:GumC family protein n=1 Tax=Alteromonas gracilis TaxID=1479524 RepID=UPI003735F487